MYWRSIFRFKFMFVPLAVVNFTYIGSGQAKVYKEVFVFGLRIASFSVIP